MLPRQPAFKKRTVDVLRKKKSRIMFYIPSSLPSCAPTSTHPRTPLVFAAELQLYASSLPSPSHAALSKSPHSLHKALRWLFNYATWKMPFMFVNNTRGLFFTWHITREIWIGPTFTDGKNVNYWIKTFSVPDNRIQCARALWSRLLCVSSQKSDR